MIKSLLITLCLLTGLYISGFSQAAERPFRMTVSVAAPLYFDNGSGLFNLITAEIFRRLELDYELVWLPAQRSLLATNNGAYDGIIAHTAAIEKTFPNLVPVPENVFDFEFMAYAKDPAIKVTGWESI